MKKVTIADVARAAGVSRTTVSYVLNGKGRISTDVVERVRAVMRQTGYEPRTRSALPAHDATRGITAGAVALALPAADIDGLRASWGGEYVDCILRGCETKLREHGLKMVITRLLQDGQPHGVDERRIDGLIIAAGIAPETCVPVVRLFDSRVPANTDVVDADDYHIGLMAAEHVIEKRCRRVVFASPQRAHVAFSIRREVFAGRLTEAGLEVRLAEYDENTGATGPRDEYVLRAVQKAWRKPDAVFIPGSDASVLALYTGMLASGVRPGRDVEFVGCMSSDVHRRALRSAACIDIRHEDQARMAVDVLLWRLGNRAAPPARVLVEPRMLR